MKKKKFALIFMPVLLVLALAACGRNASRPVSTQDAAGTVTTTPEYSTETTEAPAGKTLAAYFSRTGENYGVGVIEKGSTEIIAEMIAEKTGADIFRIKTVSAYPESYDECTAVAKRERDSGARPELVSTMANLDDYDVIYLGYPIWYGDMPMAVYTFLESCDFTGKTIIPFCTHAGSGLSGTVSSIQTACSGATVLGGLAIAGTTAQNAPEEAEKEVERFLKGLQLS